MITKAARKAWPKTGRESGAPPSSPPSAKPPSAKPGEKSSKTITKIARVTRHSSKNITNSDLLFSKPVATMALPDYLTGSLMSQRPAVFVAPAKQETKSKTSGLS